MSGLTAEQIERLAEAFYTGHGWAWGGDEMDPQDRAACVESMSSVAPVVAALIAEAVEEARDKVAREIEACYLGADFDRGYDGRESPDTALAHSYDEGLEHAARIARGEVSP